MVKLAPSVRAAVPLLSTASPMACQDEMIELLLPALMAFSWAGMFRMGPKKPPLFPYMVRPPVSDDWPW